MYILFSLVKTIITIRNRPVIKIFSVQTIWIADKLPNISEEKKHDLNNTHFFLSLLFPVGCPKKGPVGASEETIILREDDAILDEPSPKRGKYALYTPKKKTAILEEVERCGLRATSRKWKIAPSTIATWKKELAVDVPRHKGGRKVGGGRKLAYDQEIEEKVIVFIIEKREHQLPVSRDSVRQYILTLTKENYPDFKASSGWLTRFMDRNDFSVRRHTSLSQKLPADLEVRLAAFYKHLKELRTNKELDEDALILNMDEVPVVFDTVPSKIPSKRGEKDISMKTTGGEKKRYTAVLAVSASGEFLPTMTIFKGKRDPKDVQIPQGWVVCSNDKAWMREDIMIRWIKEILCPYTQRRPALLVMDSFSAHVTTKVQAELERINAFPAIIPGGCTSKAQPLDVVINKPYRNKIRKLWTLFMQDRQAQAKDSLSFLGPSRQDVIGWMEAAQNELQQTAYISKSFKVTGISTALGGAEDHMIRDPNLIPETDDDSDDEIDEFSGFEDDEVDDPFNDLCQDW